MHVYLTQGVKQFVIYSISMVFMIANIPMSFYVLMLCYVRFCYMKINLSCVWSEQYQLTVLDANVQTLTKVI